MAESPLVDIIGLGTSKGEILVVNLREDETLMKLTQSHPVTSMSFSTDEELDSFLCTTSGSEILYWNLNEQKIQSKEMNGHEGKKVDKAEFLFGEPIVVSQSGDDNSFKMWIFDKEMGLKTAP